MVNNSELGLAMTGGGARAAYQVGLLRFICREFPDFCPPVITGVSAGAVNAAYLAAYPGTFCQAVEELSKFWLELGTDNIFRTDSRYFLIGFITLGISFPAWRKPVSTTNARLAG